MENWLMMRSVPATDMLARLRWLIRQRPIRIAIMCQRTRVAGTDEQGLVFIISTGAAIGPVTLVGSQYSL